MQVARLGTVEVVRQVRASADPAGPFPVERVDARALQLPDDAVVIARWNGDLDLRVDVRAARSTEESVRALVVPQHPHFHALP